MELAHLPGRPRLTYCTNIHAGETLTEVLASLDAHVPRIRARLIAAGVLRPGQRLGLGLRLSARAAAELRSPERLAVLRGWLALVDCEVFTLNAFPYGRFHGVPVKAGVYEPDWQRPERLDYTLDCARALATLLPPGQVGSISTVPLGYRAAGPVEQRLPAMLDRLAAAVGGLARIEDETGRRIVLALEPEPDCLLESTADVLAFFREHWHTPAVARRIARETGLGPSEAAVLARRHLGVCHDVCHAAVLFEPATAGVLALRDAGIPVAKIQLSNALRVPAMSPGLAARLARFDDGVYLHQVACRAADGIARHADLPEAFAAGEPRGEWRIHCHVPLGWRGDDGIASTHAELAELLGLLRAEAISPHLEIETYTWDVLPPALRAAHKADAIADELLHIEEALK